jgi:hypothetical protein
MLFRTDKNQPRDSQRGKTAVEFAFIAALVFAIVFGILEYGLVFMQGHYVANAAREGARIGVRANNYDCFNGVIADRFNACTSDRYEVTRQKVYDYLDIFYDPTDPEELSVDVVRPNTNPANDSEKVLQVSIRARNFAPGLVSGLLRSLPSSKADINRLEYISFSTSMAYEDPREYDAETP